MAEEQGLKKGFLTVSFVGIVNYARGPSECHRWILMPNASNDFDVGYPDVLHTPHEVRLLVARGTPCGCCRLPDVRRCANHVCKSQTLPGRVLTRQQVTIESGVKSDGIAEDKTSLKKLPVLQDLAKLISKHEGTELGELPGSVFGSDADHTLSARFRIDGGTVSVKHSFPGNGSPGIFFEDTFGGQHHGEARELARDVTLEVKLCGCGERVCIGLSPLSSGDDEPTDCIHIWPDDDVVHLIVENAPATSDGFEGCRSTDPHFAAHYVLRPGFDKPVWVLVPAPKVGTSGSNDNPQCSPVRDAGEGTV